MIRKITASITVPSRRLLYTACGQAQGAGDRRQRGLRATGAEQQCARARRGIPRPPMAAPPLKRASVAPGRRERELRARTCPSAGRARSPRVPRGSLARPFAGRWPSLAAHSSAGTGLARWAALSRSRGSGARSGEGPAARAETAVSRRPAWGRKSPCEPRLRPRTFGPRPGGPSRPLPLPPWQRQRRPSWSVRGDRVPGSPRRADQPENLAGRVGPPNMTGVGAGHIEHAVAPAGNPLPEPLLWLRAGIPHSNRLPLARVPVPRQGAAVELGRGPHARGLRSRCCCRFRLQIWTASARDGSHHLCSVSVGPRH